MQYLLENKYTSTQLYKATIEYFMTYLQRHEIEAIDLYNLELDSQTLYELHRVTNVQTYL